MEQHKFSGQQISSPIPHQSPSYTQKCHKLQTSTTFAVKEPTQKKNQATLKGKTTFTTNSATNQKLQLKRPPVPRTTTSSTNSKSVDCHWTSMGTSKREYTANPASKTCFKRITKVSNA